MSESSQDERDQESPSETKDEETNAEEPGTEEKEEKPQPLQEGCKIAVFNLDFNTTEEGLKEYFSKVGPVVDVHIGRNKKGMAHVTMVNEDDGRKAIDELNHKTYDGRQLRLELSYYDKNFKGERKTPKSSRSHERRERRSHDYSRRDYDYDYDRRPRRRERYSDYDRRSRRHSHYDYSDDDDYRRHDRYRGRDHDRDYRRHDRDYRRH